MTTKTITADKANDVFALDLDQEETPSVDLALGAIDACSRHLYGIGPRLVLYPRTREGKILGTGAHPGFVRECTESEAIDLGFTSEEIFASAGANDAYQHDDQGPCCGECLSACGEYEADRDAEASVGVCWSCSQMISEGWERANAERQARHGS